MILSKIFPLKIIVTFLFLVWSIKLFADIDPHGLGLSLYPKSDDDQSMTRKFFQVVESHKRVDPFRGGPGPSIKDYRLDKIKFAFLVNDTGSTVDLVFFNWSLPTFVGLEPLDAISKLYGSPVYILRGIPKNILGTQGENYDEIWNFSYIKGSQAMEAELKLSNPNYPIDSLPEEMLNWKPHPKYIDRSHPLRKALNTNSLMLISPSLDWLFKRINSEQISVIKDTPQIRDVLMSHMQSEMFKTILHESFHLKALEDQANGLAKKRKLDLYREDLVQQLKTDPHLRTLFGTYIQIVFSIGEQLKRDSLTTIEQDLLADLKTVITELKTKYQNAWNFIWDYEYTEGFANYVTDDSIIQSGLEGLKENIDSEIKAKANNFTYRTGALGGLYLAVRLNQMPFKNNEDHRESVWEIILRLSKTPSQLTNLQEVIGKYPMANETLNDEIQRVTEYLTTTQKVITF